MPVYTYECKCGNVFDDLRPIKRHSSCKCPGCGQRARQIPATFHLDYLSMGTDPSLPTSADKWAKLHEDKAKSKSAVGE